MAKDEKPTTEAIPEESCTISDEDMMRLPHSAWALHDKIYLERREAINADPYKLKKSNSGQFAEVDWLLFSHGLSAAMTIAKAYVAKVYPDGIMGDPVRMSKAEMKALGSAYAGEPGLGDQYALDKLAELIHDLFYLKLHASALSMHGSVLMSKSMMKNVPQD